MSKEPSAAEKLFGDFAPKLVELADEVLFYSGWPNSMNAVLLAKELLSKREASI